MSTLETNLIQPATGTALTVGASGDTITIPSGATIVNSGTATGFGESNTPAFMATATSDQAFSDDTVTKMEFGTELYDTDNTYSSNKFTPGVAGKYQIFSTLDLTGDGDYQRLDMIRIYLYKNGSSHQQWTFDFRTGTTPTAVITYAAMFNTVVDANTTDYYEVYGYVDSRTVAPKTNDVNTLFGANRIIT